MLPKFSSKAFLAPMAGVSDPALRLQCKKMGAGLVVTEFTNIHSIIAKEKQLKDHMKTIEEFIEFSDEERPLSIQLFGSDLLALEKAAKIVEPYFDIIDYNMGCPAPHITQQMAGGALLQQANLTEQIFETLVGAVKKPVTLKIRSGVTDASRFLFRDIAEIAEDKGIQILGVSLDNESDNKAFAEKFSFPYPLLCDVNREIALAYHAVKNKDDQYASRVSYVIDEEGKIIESIENVDTKNHSKDLCSRH